MSQRTFNRVSASREFQVNLCLIEHVALDRLAAAGICWGTQFIMAENPEGYVRALVLGTMPPGEAHLCSI